MTPAMILRTRLAPALAAAVLLLTVIAAGCGDDGQSPSGSAAALVADGWALFVSGDYQSAVTKFEQAKAADRNYRDAYDGLGWSHARLGDLSSAEAAFLHIQTKLVNPSRATYTGEAIVALALKKYTEAASNANWAIERYTEPYQFQYDPEVTHITLRLIRATARFNEAEYESAYADVVVLNSLLGLGLPPLNPSSSDFVAKLLKQIQTIRAESGGGLL